MADAAATSTMVATNHRNTLLHFRFNPEYTAQRGRHGEGSNRTGHEGESLTVQVPVGTTVFDDETGETAVRFHRRRADLDRGQRRTRRTRQRAFRHFHPSGAHRA